MARQQATNHNEPNSGLLRLLYSSRVARSRTASGIEDDIEAILHQSRAANLAFGITGVLVTDKRMYSQVIEGPTAAVKNLIGHISCDSRHEDIRIISHHGAERRIFEEWSMAFIATNRKLEAETYLFPSSDEQSNIMAISSFCSSVRSHLLDKTVF